VKVNSLYFEWPLGLLKDPVSVVMILSNKTQQKVCFKVKTSPVKCYCVEPARGVIDPKGVVTILVTLQLIDLNEKGKHEVQVLSVHAPEGEFNIETLVSFKFFSHDRLYSHDMIIQQWQEASPDTVHDWKLKCDLEIPEDGVAPVTADNNVESHAAPPAPTVTALAIKNDDGVVKKSILKVCYTPEYKSTPYGRAVKHKQPLDKIALKPVPVF
jgi:MSP (Major sperm protein) domain